MDSAAPLKGFNTTLQQVEEKYSWINDMIKQRQDLLLLYMKLLTPNLKDNSAEECPPTYEEITNFCDHLIDYVSHGHFDLYPKIIEIMENASGRSLSIANRVMPKIDQTSDYIMRFNDRYAEDMNEAKLKTLRKDLAELGKCIELRFRSEDRLIIGLRLVHAVLQSPK